MFILIEDPTFVRWCNQGITEVTLVQNSNADVLKPHALLEKQWGNEIMGKLGDKQIKQRTTSLCETGVKEILEALGYTNVRKARNIKSTVIDKKYMPDLESDECVREVKGRNRTTPGTAGEKILGTPVKYSEVPKLYGKPLKIVLVGYQEREARNGFQCGNLLEPSLGGTEELEQILEVCKSLDIEYVGMTDLLKKSGRFSL